MGGLGGSIRINRRRFTVPSRVVSHKSLMPTAQFPRGGSGQSALSRIPASKHSSDEPSRVLEMRVIKHHPFLERVLDCNSLGSDLGGINFGYARRPLHLDEEQTIILLAIHPSRSSFGLL